MVSSLFHGPVPSPGSGQAPPLSPRWAELHAGISQQGERISQKPVVTAIQAYMCMYSMHVINL